MLTLGEASETYNYYSWNSSVNLKSLQNKNKLKNWKKESDRSIPALFLFLWI